MSLARKHVSLAILMGLLIGHFGMAVHATTHALGEAGECELCLSYNDASEALVSLPQHGVVPVRQTVTTTPPVAASQKRGWAPYLQRDPPGSI